MKTIQQQCTEKVYTLLPELKELKFSCQIALEPYGDRETIHTVYKAYFTEYNKVVPYQIDTCCGEWTPTSLYDGKWKHEMRIGGWHTIGQKIGIAEVLRAIDMKYGTIVCQTNGSNLNFYIDNDPFSKATWHLLDDNILSQSSETCEFILSVLK